MIGLKIKDVDLEEDHGVVHCEDEEGNDYSFPISKKQAKLLILFLNGIYIPGNTIHDFVIEILGASSLNVDRIVIERRDKVVANVYVKFQDHVKNFYLSVPDALVLSLATRSNLFIRRNTDFIKAEEVLWSSFIKELL